MEERSTAGVRTPGQVDAIFQLHERIVPRYIWSVHDCQEVGNSPAETIAIRFLASSYASLR